MGERNSPWPLGGFAPGNYTCKCVRCEAAFVGDKRASNCLECAVRSANEYAARMKAENGLLQSELVGAWTTMSHPKDTTYEAARARSEARFNAMIATFHDARTTQQRERL